MDEHINKPAICKWLNNGGAEIVLDVLRRNGWEIETLTGDDWEFVDDGVVVGSRNHKKMYICGTKGPWAQAFFAAMLYNGHEPARDTSRGSHELQMIREGDQFYEPCIWLCYNFIDQIRISSEVTIAHMNAVSAAGPVGGVST